MYRFYSFVSQVSHYLCPPFSAGHVAFLFICLPGLSPFFAGHVGFLFICLPGLSLLVSALFRWPCLSLVVSALFRWPCSVSIHLSPRSDSFVSQVCRWWCPPFSAGHVAFLFICLPGLSLLASALFRWPCSVSINLSPINLFPMWFVYFCFPGSVPALLASALFPLPAFLFICLPGDVCTSPNGGSKWLLCPPLPCNPDCAFVSQL